MKNETKKYANKLLRLVQEANQYSNPIHPAELFKLAQELLAGQAWLMTKLISAEANYRQKIIDYKNEVITESTGKITKITNAEAENKAKVTEEYQDYNYLRYVYNLVDQQILLIKKFSDKLTEEENRNL